MTTSDYKKVLKNAILRFAKLSDEREELDVELAKLRQFIHATANLVSDKDRAALLAIFNDLDSRSVMAASSLIDSIRLVMAGDTTKWMTAADVKRALEAQGFNFGSYVSNPLSSVSTTLRRLKEHREVETDEIEGVTVFRSLATPPLTANVYADLFGGTRRTLAELTGSEGSLQKAIGRKK
jgi:hypothetical protein